MPFRTPAARQHEDIDRHDGPEHGLAKGEWVEFWRAFPHSLVGRIATAATRADIDPRTGAMVATFDAGTAALTRVMLAIVNWRLLDDDGQEVPWDPAKARELIDGLPPETFKVLQQRAGNPREVPILTDKADPDDPAANSETVGNGSGGSSPTS